MECNRQAYWHSEYTEYKKCIKKSPSNLSYKRFAKQQYHSVRRQYDEKLIKEQLNNSHRRAYPVYLNTNDINLDRFNNIPYTWAEHNNKSKLTEHIQWKLLLKL